MALVIPDAAEVVWLTRALYGDASAEDLSLRLASNNITPAESDVAGTYTVATFTGYANKTITSSQSGSTWAVPTTSAGTTSSTYATTQTWSPTSSQTLYNLYYLFATSGTIAAAESLGGARTVANGDSFSIIPKFEMA